MYVCMCEQTYFRVNKYISYLEYLHFMFRLSILSYNTQDATSLLNDVPKCPQINNQHDLIKQIASVFAGNCCPQMSTL